MELREGVNNYMVDDPIQDDNSAAAAPASDAVPAGNTDKYGRSLFKAVCAKCGGEAMVPFQPTAGRPVYCQNCYQPRQRRDFGGGAGGSRGGHSGRSFSDRSH